MNIHEKQHQARRTQRIQTFIFEDYYKKIIAKFYYYGKQWWPKPEKYDVNCKVKTTFAFFMGAFYVKWQPCILYSLIKNRISSSQSLVCPGFSQAWKCISKWAFPIIRPWRHWTRGNPSCSPSSLTLMAASKPSATTQAGLTRSMERVCM